LLRQLYHLFKQLSRRILGIFGVKGVRLNLPQFNGHAEKGYHSLRGVFDEQTSVQDLQQGIQTGSHPSGRSIRQHGHAGGQGIGITG